MGNDDTRGEDRQNLEAACEAHGWRLRVTGEPPEAIVEIAGAKLSATAATEEEACSRVVAALLAIGGLEVFVA